jgi:methylthioribose-1-phosphate isomerase
MATPDGDRIPIEQRAAREVTHLAGKQIAPDGIKVENPAFDVTPNKYVTAIITEYGLARQPFHESLKKLESIAKERSRETLEAPAGSQSD